MQQATKRIRIAAAMIAGGVILISTACGGAGVNETSAPVESPPEGTADSSLGASGEFAPRLSCEGGFFGTQEYCQDEDGSPLPRAQWPLVSEHFPGETTACHLLTQSDFATHEMDLIGPPIFGEDGDLSSCFYEVTIQFDTERRPRGSGITVGLVWDRSSDDMATGTNRIDTVPGEQIPWNAHFHSIRWQGPPDSDGVGEQLVVLARDRAANAS